MQKSLSALAAATLATLAIDAHAALYDRGNGLIYDSALNITWLQDANYSRTSGYDATGQMTWAEAMAWAANFSYAGYDDWRLPSARLIGQRENSYDGSTDYGYNNIRSEMGHLFHELGNVSAYTPDGKYQSALGNDKIGLVNRSFIDAATLETKSFVNLFEAFYWENETDLTDDTASWTYCWPDGGQVPLLSSFSVMAWAVRDGDVAAVPVPAAAWLFGSGLIALAGTARRKR